MADDREDQIRRRAHEIWEAEGKPHGRDRLHWDQAAEELAGGDSAEVQAEAAIDVVEDAKKAIARKRKTPAA